MAPKLKLNDKLAAGKEMSANLMGKIKSIWAPIAAFFGKIKDNLAAIYAKSKVLKAIFNKKVGIIALIAVVGAYLISGAVFATGIYKYKWGGKARKYGERVYPLPAAYVGGHLIWLKNYDKSYDQSKYFMAKNNQAIPDEAQFERDMLSQMVDLEVWKIQAKKYNVSVSKDDFNSSYSKLVEQAGGEEKAKEMLSEFWGMSLDDLKQLINDQLPKQKLTDKMENEVLVAVKAQHILIKDDENLAKDVAAKAKSGTDFNSLVKEYSQDTTTKDQNGELGWFTRGVMDPDFEKAAFGMKVGDISDPVKSQFGFHIIKIEDHRGTIDKSLQDWFNEAKNNTKVIKFVAK